MIEFGLSFHHLGLAVEKPETAVIFAQGLGYVMDAPIFDELQNVNLIMCNHATAPAIEIIYPGKGSGPVDALINRHANGIVYHTCYVTKDLAATREAFRTAKLRCICVSPPKPAILFDGAAVSFYQIVGAGLIEIVEK